MMNSSYEQFASVYDRLMEDVPYEKYLEWITKFAPSEEFPKLLDVGCGTGKLAQMFHTAGYDVSGVDLSEDMLAIANERFQEEGITIPLYAMSMDELDGFFDFDVVTIPIDSINYLENEQAVKETLARIYQSLRQGGLLFFDVHSLYKMNDIFMDSPFTYDDGQITYVWHTEPGQYEHSVFHQMTFFVEDEATGQYERFDEEHFQRTYSPETFVNWLKGIGFSEVIVTADWTEEEPSSESERIFIQAIK